MRKTSPKVQKRQKGRAAQPQTGPAIIPRTGFGRLVNSLLNEKPSIERLDFLMEIMCEACEDYKLMQPDSEAPAWTVQATVMGKTTMHEVSATHELLIPCLEAAVAQAESYRGVDHRRLN